MNREELNGIGKDGIVSEGIFVRFPELVPVCREHYWREDGKHKKLLMVAESNYFNDADVPNSDFRDAERWYKAADAKLIPDYRRTAVSNDIGYKTFDKVFVLMGKVLDEYGIEHVEGLGEANPVADNSTAAGREQNRRVEVYLTASQAMIEAAQAEAGATN